MRTCESAKSKYYALTMLLLMFLPFSSSCSDSEFTGASFEGAGSNGEKGNDNRSESELMQQLEPNATDADLDPQLFNDGSLTPPQTIVVNDQATCLARRAHEYNILIAIDRSGSMLTVDPAKAREQAPLDLVNKLSQLAQKHESLNINVATIGFCGSVLQGNNGWVKLSESGTPQVRTDITQVATGTCRFTNYLAAFTTATSLFSQRTGSTDLNKQRNHVIFLTDGAPNRPSGAKAERVRTTEELVANFKVAIAAIALGRGLSSRAISTVREVGLPSEPNAHFPGHHGRFIRVEDAGDLVDSFQDLYLSITDCK